MVSNIERFPNKKFQQLSLLFFFVNPWMCQPPLRFQRKEGSSQFWLLWQFSRHHILIHPIQINRISQRGNKHQFQSICRCLSPFLPIRTFSSEAQILWVVNSFVFPFHTQSYCIALHFLVCGKSQCANVAHIWLHFLHDACLFTRWVFG